MTTTQEYFYGVGKRKTAVARVKLIPGRGEVIINGKAADDYFGGPRFNTLISQAFGSTSTTGTLNALVTVRGGGLSGQAGAVRHAIARAILAGNPDARRALRGDGLLTRDARIKERKKPGLKRARKAPQYTKR